MDRVKKLKVKKTDGSFTDYIPIGADAQYIDLENGSNVQDEMNKMYNKPYYFNSVADMKAAEYLKEGDCVITLGYYEANDGGGAFYKIRNIENTDIVNEMNIISLNNFENYVAELIYNSTINIMQLGAVPVNSGFSDNYETRNIIIKALELLDKTGGIIEFPAGTFVCSGEITIQGKGEITFKGTGINTTNIWYSGTNSYLFWVQNNKDELDRLFIPVTFKDFTIRGINGTGTGFIISDRYGCKIENIFSEGFSNGTFIKLYNYNGWTEGTEIINCNIRNALYGIVFERNNENENATESFNYTKILRCSMDISVNDGAFIYTSASASKDKKIIIYNSEIDCTCWYGTEENRNTSRHIISLSPWTLLFGTANITQDGLLTNNQTCAFNIQPNSQLSLEGSFQYNNATILNLAEYKIENIIPYNYNYTPFLQPSFRFKGLRIVNYKNIPSNIANTVIYSSGKLPNFADFNVKINYEINGLMRCQTWRVTTTSNNFTIACNPSVVGPDIVFVRPINGKDQQVISEGNGSEFEIYIANNTSNARLSMEIEML